MVFTDDTLFSYQAVSNYSDLHLEVDLDDGLVGAVEVTVAICAACVTRSLAKRL